MSFQVEKFHHLVKQIEIRNMEWFQNMKPDDKNSQVIEGHYYVYYDLSEGHQLRFKPYSELPVSIREEIHNIFSELKTTRS